ncbi:hypothetical protein PanWU01x14_051400 [Parasponia andersonii]|uniref:Uncharacterized protein n=1 Tax=Parasponia andersonii TaxID=3476 RepID=A0A2P5DM02_PARAD|nr:hypothetical protein PanWU01x14_051400 [Parasponia andersonii]
MLMMVMMSMVMMMSMTMTMTMTMAMTMMMGLLPFKLFPHIISIFTIRIVLSLHIMNLVPQSLRIQVKRSSITLPHMKGYILSSKDLFHGVLGRAHELGGEP